MEIWQFDLRRGNSSDPREGACFLDAVSWFEYGTLGDHPPCVCPVVASFARVVNDLLPDDQRQKLKPFLLRVIGTVDPASERARTTFLMWQAVRGFAPLALEAAASVAVGNHPAILRRHAAKLRGQTEASDAASVASDAASVASAASVDSYASSAASAASYASSAASAASVASDAASVARAASYASSAASDAAWAASYASSAASAASVASDAASVARAASYASSAASDAAWAASYASSAACAASDARAASYASSVAFYDLSIATLDGVLRIGRQAEPILPARIEVANRSFEIARA